MTSEASADSGTPPRQPSPLRGEGAEGRRRGVFFGWYIVAASSGIMFLISALMEQAFGGYAAALARDYGWSRTALGGAFSASRLLGSLTGYPQGRIIDRIGAKAVMRTGLVVFALGFFLFARLDSLPMFYAASIVMAVGANIGGFLGITVVVVNWFDRMRARAIGLSFLGFAAGGLAAPIVILAITTNWRLTAAASGIAVLLIGLPLTTLLHHRPESRRRPPPRPRRRRARAQASRSRSARRSARARSG